MSITSYRIKPNLYRDSVTLMRVASTLLAKPGVSKATAMMATPANRAAFASSGLQLPTDSRLTPDDLLLMVEGESTATVEAALNEAEAELERRTRGHAAKEVNLQIPHTLSESLALAPNSNLALISVPGEYAFAEALKALKAGLHVFLFSSGVSLEDEAQLKQVAVERGLLMMGAECGTAIINGVPLGFANQVRRGSIGLVGASGTGLQEVSSLIHNGGGGISQAIGTGGRDLSVTVGGTMMLAGFRLLADDPGTQVIALLSKPPAPAVAERILEAARQVAKPVIIAFLGGDPEPIRAAGLIPATTLEDAAERALVASGIQPPKTIFGRNLPGPELAPKQGCRRLVRGLYSGGTLCSEAQLILQTGLGPIARPTAANPNPNTHTCLDLGEEEFTIGRPHPMIDGLLRAEKMKQAAKDPHTLLILFDVVLGYGASLDPCIPLLEVIRQARKDCTFVAHVCGTEQDPQGLSRQVGLLREAGVMVAPTNAAAARLALELVNQ